MDYILPGSSVHGISQARILECVAISLSRGSSQRKDQTHVSCIGGEFFTTEPPVKPSKDWTGPSNKQLCDLELVISFSGPQAPDPSPIPVNSEADYRMVIL